MWKNVFIENQLAKSFLKAAIKAGHVKLSTPENDHESVQIRRLSKEINRSRREKAALYYCLLFEKVFLNELSWGGGYLFENEDDENIECRSIFETASSDFSSFVNAINPQINHCISLHEEYSTKDKLNLFATCEPMIWHNWKKTGEDRINREVLRDILDFMIINPEQVELIRDVGSFQSMSISDWKEIFLIITDLGEALTC